jgi:hypothetical protein
MSIRTAAQAQAENSYYSNAKKQKRGTGSFSSGSQRFFTHKGTFCFYEGKVLWQEELAGAARQEKRNRQETGHVPIMLYLFLKGAKFGSFSYSP